MPIMSLELQINSLTSPLSDIRFIPFTDTIFFRFLISSTEPLLTSYYNLRIQSVKERQDMTINKRFTDWQRGSR